MKMLKENIFKLNLRKGKKYKKKDNTEIIQHVQEIKKKYEKWNGSGSE